MFENIKEIVIGVTQQKNRKGEISAGSIYFIGRPIPKGVYTAEKLPLGWTHGWPEFCRFARKHDGHGVEVVYKTDKAKPSRPEVIPNG